MSRPLAITRAYRIIASPYIGWLYKDQWWSDEEWQKAERRRLYERVRKQPRPGPFRGARGVGT